MQIGMRGFNVVYKNQTYICLHIHPYNETTVYRDGFTYCNVEMLHVVVINPDGRFEILDDMSGEFRFIKE